MPCQQDRVAANVQYHCSGNAMVLMQGGGKQLGVLPGFAKVAMPAAPVLAFIQLPAGGCGSDGEQESCHVPFIQCADAGAKAVEAGCTFVRPTGLGASRTVT